MLPRGRVGLRVFIFASLTLLLASCTRGSTADVPPTTPASPTATVVATGSRAIPTLGTTPPSGLVLPRFFVAVIDSNNGSVSVLTSPGSNCSLSVSAPSGLLSDYPVQRVDAKGNTAFAYPPSTGRGQSVQTVRCTLGDLTGVAEGQVLLP